MRTAAGHCCQCIIIYCCFSSFRTMACIEMMYTLDRTLVHVTLSCVSLHGWQDFVSSQAPAFCSWSLQKRRFLSHPRQCRTQALMPYKPPLLNPSWGTVQSIGQATLVNFNFACASTKRSAGSAQPCSQNRTRANHVSEFALKVRAQKAVHSVDLCA